MAVAPHPQMGLQTASWLVQGAVLQRDSIGSTALVEPGRVAIMNAGNGIAHSENSPDDHGPVLHGVQLWVVLPESARRGEHSFVLHEKAPILVARFGEVSHYPGRSACGRRTCPTCACAHEAAR